MILKQLDPSPSRATGLIVKYSKIFKPTRVAKKIWRIINTIASIWGENMLGYLSLDIICSSRLTVFLAHSFPRAALSENCLLLGTDNVRGQISVHIFAPNGSYCLYLFAPNGDFCFYIIMTLQNENKYLCWTSKEAFAVYYTVIKHGGHWRKRGICKKNMAAGECFLHFYLM